MKKLITILFVLVYYFGACQVPNTTTFTLQNVVDEINPTTDDLADCISDADAAKYDPTYYTSPATSLLEFRNYGWGGGYGWLYNGNICSYPHAFPTGWDIPTTAQYAILSNYLGGNSVSGGKLKETGTAHWQTPNTGATNSSGFTGLGGGFRWNETLKYNDIKQKTWFWLKTEYSTGYRYFADLNYNDDNTAYNAYISFIYGYSVRLLYTGLGTPPETIADYDGNIYEVVKIGTQYWLKQNWKCTHSTIGASLTYVESTTTWANATYGGTPYYCAYNDDVRNVYDSNEIQQSGIIATPNNYTFPSIGTSSTSFNLEIIPDVAFSISNSGDILKFTVSVNQTTNTISCYPKGDNTSGADYVMNITVTAPGFITEIITVVQSYR